MFFKFIVYKDDTIICLLVYVPVISYSPSLVIVTTLPDTLYPEEENNIVVDDIMLINKNKYITRIIFIYLFIGRNESLLKGIKSLW